MLCMLLAIACLFFNLMKTTVYYEKFRLEKADSQNIKSAISPQFETLAKV